MTRRSRAREIALQLLFWRDLNPNSERAAIERFASERLHDPELTPFCLNLFDTVVARSAEIDRLLTESADNWRLARMAAVDRNALRIGVAELLIDSHDAPPAVVINEAIEVARRYGSKDSPAFVNGVLDKVQQLRAEEIARATDVTEVPASESEGHAVEYPPTASNSPPSENSVGGTDVSAPESASEKPQAATEIPPSESPAS